MNKDIRTPDQVTKGIESGFQWIQKNVAIFVVILLVFVAAGAGWSIWDHLNLKKEDGLQGELALTEKDYFEKKDKFKEASRAEEMKKLAPAKDKKAEAPKDMPSGDLQKDYGSFIQKFNELVDKSPKSKAASMAALYAAEIYMEYKQPEQALQVLNKVSHDKATDTLSSLVLNLKAGLMADQGDCQSAVGIWQNVSTQKHVNYLHDEAKLRMALCYEKMNDVAKAEQIYTELSKTSTDPEATRAVSDDAKKYLRLLKLRANGGT